jgi:hypothetical protein
LIQCFFYPVVALNWRDPQKMTKVDLSIARAIAHVLYNPFLEEWMDD